MKFKIKLTILIAFVMVIYGFNQGFYNAAMQEIDMDIEDDFEIGETMDDDYVFTVMDIDGNIVEVDIESLEQSVIDSQDEIATSQSMFNTLDAVGGTSDYCVVNFQTQSSSLVNTSYTNADTGASGYLNGYYGIDAAYLGLTDSGQVIFKMSGVTGYVDANKVQVISIYDTTYAKYLSYYAVVNGNLYHYTTLDLDYAKDGGYYGVTQVGYQQSYMEEGVKYYSYDGHYFYTSYEDMIDDYVASTSTKALNASSPYYNYYQFLSHRSTTTFTAEQLDAYVASKNKTNSVMEGTGSTFIENQNIYGVNASLMFGVAANESAWGTSTIATTKNNLFGHSAYDSDPDSASGYSSVAYSIYYHANEFISQGYLDPCDGKNTSGNGYSSSLCQLGRYNGAHLGDKASGINVKYASDPYWGEKAASISWQLNNEYPEVKDYETYTIGIKTSSANYNVRSDSTTSSSVLYQTGTYISYPVIILGEISGETVSGNSLWYQIQSDPTLNSSATKMTQDVGVYDFDTYIGYIHSNGITVVSNSDVIPDITPPYTLGDVNEDGNIGAIDYLMIKASILGTTSLSTNQKLAADVNGDGSVGAIDYLMVKAYILGTLTSFQ